MTMHAAHREVVVARLVQRPDVAVEGVVLLLQGGCELPRYDTDTHWNFRQESNFQYLFGVKEPDCYAAIRPSDGRSVLFIPKLAQEYAAWMGPVKSQEFFQKAYEVDAVFYTEDLVEKLKSDLGATALAVVSGTNLDSGIEFTRPSFPGMDEFPLSEELSKAFTTELTEARVVKSPSEMQLMQFVNDVSTLAHIEVMRTVKPFTREYLSEATFRYQSFLRGCGGTGYDCICPTGKRNAILHYGHAAEPNAEEVAPGSMKLHDMGSEYHGYSADVTVSFPVGGRFNREQRAVYETVWEAVLAVERRICPGVSYKDMHRLAHRTMLEQMVKHGLLKGSVDEMVEIGLIKTFMFHGLGHNLGLDVHDVGGYKPGESRADDPSLTENLRCGRELQEGHVLTVEPGFYFTDFLLQEALANPAKARFIDRAVLERMRPVGGVRIEDDVVVTATGCKVFTNVPRTVREIMAVMAGADWTMSGTCREYVAKEPEKTAGAVAHYRVKMRGLDLSPVEAHALAERQPLRAAAGQV